MEVTEKNRTKYRMPGEFEPHEGCVMIWPERPGSWNYGAREAQKAFVKVAEAIGESEKECKESAWECFRCDFAGMRDR